MSTKFSSTELLNFAMKANLVTQAHAQVMHRWAYTDPHTLANRPDLLQRCLTAQKDLENLAQHPVVQNAIQPAAAPALSVQRHQPASVVQSMIRDGLGQPQPQPRSISPKQGRLTQRGNVVIYDAASTHLAQQIQPQPGAYALQAPNLVLKAGIEGVQRSLEELPARLAAALKRLDKKAARHTPVQKAQVQQHPPQLPISPITGQPSSITAAVRRSTMGEPNPTAGLHPYQAEQQRQQQTIQQKANYVNGLPISPITGAPSQITAIIRKSTL